MTSVVAVTAPAANAPDMPTPSDDEQIDRLLKRLYEVISFAEDDEPDWAGMVALFSPHARITRITPEGADYLDVPAFQGMARKLIDLGVYPSFYEHEVRRTVARFGGVAHVLSAYETRRDPAAVEPFARGVNSFQLIREAEGWRVLSLCWDEENERNPLHLDVIFGA